MNDGVSRGKYEALMLERNRWIAAFTRLDGAIEKHRRRMSDQHPTEEDEVLYSTHEKVLKEVGP